MQNFLVAHRLEAEPIIRALDLRQIARDDDSLGGLHGFANADTDAALVVCGQGAAAARLAATRMLKCRQARDALWCNFGVAGGAGFAAGQLVQAVTAIDASGAAHALHRAETGLPQATLYTRTTPETQYAERGVYDMEAAAIAEAIHPARLVCIKLVADDARSPLGEWDRQRLRECLQQHARAIVAVIQSLPRKL